MKNIQVTIGDLRTSYVFPKWKDNLDLPDDYPVTLHADGSVNDCETGDLLCPGVEGGLIQHIMDMNSYKAALATAELLVWSQKEVVKTLDAVPTAYGMETIMRPIEVDICPILYTVDGLAFFFTSQWWDKGYVAMKRAIEDIFDFDI